MAFTFETEDQVKDAARSIEQREYWETVKSLAKEAFESSDDESDQDDFPLGEWPGNLPQPTGPLRVRGRRQ